MKHFVNVYTDKKLSDKVIDLVKYMIEKFVDVSYIERTMEDNSFTYSYILDESLSEDEMEVITEFVYQNFTQEIYFENSVDTDDMDDETFQKMLVELAKFMHSTMVKEKMDAGWRYGENFSMEQKTSPLLVPYENLPEKYQQVRPDIFNKVMEILQRA